MSSVLMLTWYFSSILERTCGGDSGQVGERVWDWDQTHVDRQKIILVNIFLFYLGKCLVSSLSIIRGRFFISKKSLWYLFCYIFFTAGYTGNQFYNIFSFTTDASTGKTGNRAPALYLHGGNWWSSPGLKGLMESISGRIYSIQRNRIYTVLLTQTKHLDKVQQGQTGIITFDLISTTNFCCHLLCRACDCSLIHSSRVWKSDIFTTN